MKTVILDTSFLLIPHQFRIDILWELEKLLEQPHELVVSGAIMQELGGLSRGRGKRGVAARVALEGIRKKGFKVLDSGGLRADDWIAEYCRQNPKTIVCTNDSALRQRVKEAGSRVIVMRTRTKIFWG